jgi:hypothetical protein
MAEVLDVRIVIAGIDPMGQAFRPIANPEFLSTTLDPADMAAHVMTFAPATDADALKLLRTSFPDCSLSMRVAALDFLMRRRPRGSAKPYRPR